MYKKITLILIAFLLFTKTVFAGGFNLKSIGGVNTSGQQISHWWYTGLAPTFVGDAIAGSTVNISIDGTSATATADASGNWSYNGGTLSGGDHAIILTNDSSTIKFTLTLGAENVNWDAVNSGSDQVLPATGVALPTIILLSGSLILFFVSKRLV